jgi:CHAT domain-containing protein/tetratricopeptide (TPR) repeat protein
MKKLVRRGLRQGRWLVGLLLTSLLIVLGMGDFFPVHAKEPARAQIQQGIERYHAGDLRGAIDLWNSSLSPSEQSASQIEVLKYLARAYQQVGELERSLAQFELILAYYQQSKNAVQVGRILTEQAQVLTDLGQYRQAIALLCGESKQSCSGEGAVAIAQREADLLGQTAALGSLGTVYYLQGEYEPALTALQQSRAIAENLGDPHYLTATLNDLGNVYTSLGQRETRYLQFAQQSQDDQATQQFKQRSEKEIQNAIVTFETSLSIAQNQDLLNEIRASIGLILPYSQQNPQKAQALLPQVQTQLKQLPDSREKAYILIKLASLTTQLASNTFTTLPSDFCSSADVSPLLNQAYSIAQKIQDYATESFALGLLGHQSECAKNYSQALNLTYQAELLATADEVRYLWEWQTGRILKAQGQVNDALASYGRTITTLKKIQGNIAAANRDLRLDFQENSEAIYRQLATFRLQQAEQAGAEQQTQLTLAVEALDGLRLAELRNYLGSQCEIPLAESSLTAINAQTAVFQSLVLDDRILIILILPEPDGKSTLKLHQVAIDRATTVSTVNQFRQRLEQRSDRENRYQEQSQEIYNWFIRPFITDLQSRSVKTLVFIQDDILRTVPMAVLSNGQEFLIQQYAIANTSSLSLPRTQSQTDYNLQILAFGLTQPSAINKTTFFSPLESVQAEIEGIQQRVSNSDGLLDQDFTPERLQNELRKERPRILHLATHARFGFDARETFLVTGREPNRTYNSTVSMNELYQILRSVQTTTAPLELLALTGCETAAGSQRDALGIAGVAVQAGAQSAIATLWQVDDAATAQLIVQFYQNLQAGQTKSEALQSAQRSWLAANPNGQYQHPGYWAAFVLVGNWL